MPLYKVEYKKFNRSKSQMETVEKTVLATDPVDAMDSLDFENSNLVGVNLIEEGILVTDVYAEQFH